MTNGWRRRAARTVALAGLVLAGTAVPSVATTRLSLVRQVTITGDRTGWVAVTLPKTVFPDTKKVTFSGGAFGYELTYENDTADRPVPTAVVLRLPKSQGGELISLVSGIDPRTGKDASETWRLPAGNYRLFLLTTGRGSAKITFSELAARTLATKPTRATSYRATEAKPDYVGPLGPSAWASGITVDPHGVRSHGYGFQWTDGPAAANSVEGGCVYDGPPWNGKWVPGCPFGRSLMSNQLTPALDCCGTGYGVVIGGSDPFSFGQYYVQSGPVTKAGMFFVWLPDR